MKRLTRILGKGKGKGMGKGFIEFLGSIFFNGVKAANVSSTMKRGVGVYSENETTKVHCGK